MVLSSLTTESRLLLSEICVGFLPELIELYKKISDIPENHPFRGSMLNFYPEGEMIAVSREYEIELIEEVLRKNSFLLKCSPLWCEIVKKGAMSPASGVKSKWEFLERIIGYLNERRSEYAQEIWEMTRVEGADFELLTLPSKPLTPQQNIRVGLEHNGKVYNVDGWLAYLQGTMDGYFHGYPFNKTLSDSRYWRYLKLVADGWYLGLQFDVKSVASELTNGYVPDWKIDIVLLHESNKKSTSIINWLDAEKNNKITSWSASIASPFAVGPNLEPASINAKQLFLYSMWSYSQVMNPVLDLLSQGVESWLSECGDLK